MKLALEMDELYEKYKNDVNEYTYEKVQVYREIKVIGLFYRRYRNGGVERVISYLMPLFIKMGYRVILITEEEVTSDDYILPSEVDRYTICSLLEIVYGKERYEKRACDLISVINKTNMDVIIYEDLCSPMAYWDCILANQLDIYVIGHWHGMFSQNISKFSWINGIINLCHILDKVVVLSKAEVAFWKMYGIKAEYIFNPVLQKNDKGKKIREDIVWVGRLDDPIYKRYMDVIHIMKKVVVKHPDIKLYIYGKGRDYEERIINRIILDSGLKDNVIMGGYKTSVDEIYKTARIHLVTSASESFPMIICESKGMGIPLVTYDMPYVETLQGYKGYISVPYADYDAAANAIISILDDKEMEKRLSVSARKSLSIFSEEELARRWNRLLDELQSKNASISIIEKIHKKDVIDFIGKCVKDMAIKKDEIIEVFHKLTYAKMLRKVRYVYAQKKKIVIYPYGQVGRYVEGFLKENDIQVDYAIDENATSNSVTVKRLDELKEEDLKDRLVIICNNKLVYWEEIRRNLEKYNKIAEVYDICPKEKMIKSVVEGLGIWW